MIELDNLTKVYGDKTAVDHLNLTLKPGLVTGLLGPNGSGKSTTIKMIISLVNPTAGSVTINSNRYTDYPEPFKQIGTLIDPSILDENLTAKHHLSIIATAANIKPVRVEKMLQITGLEEVKDKKVKLYSLGMKQRLGIASALISDPDTIILDEPFNGLDIDGIKWLRTLFKRLAEEGKSVVVSSHLMSEIQKVADRVVIIGRGSLLADMTMEEMNEKSLSAYVYVEAENLDKLKSSMEEKQAVTQQQGLGLEVRNLEAKEIGKIARDQQLVLHELKNVRPSLEALFMEITAGKSDYVSQGAEDDESDQSRL